jgi:hypothetical protein
VIIDLIEPEEISDADARKLRINRTTGFEKEFLDALDKSYPKGESFPRRPTVEFLHSQWEDFVAQHPEFDSIALPQ